MRLILITFICNKMRMRIVLITLKIHRLQKMRSVTQALAVTTTLGLAACGGGGTQQLSSANPANLAAIEGTVAIGAPWVGASVEIRCATGQANATTDANGTYQVSAAALDAPCVVRAQGGTAAGMANTQVLHGATAALGRANVTPLTELVLTRWLEEPPAGFYTEFRTDARRSQMSAATFQAAQAQVLTQLQGLGVNTAALDNRDVMSDRFAANASDAHDQVLDALDSRLVANNLTLTQYTTDMAQLVPPAPCASATGFCWPVTDYKLLMEGRRNTRGAP